MTDFDLKTLNLADGTHRITVVAKASGYRDSEPSTAVSYVVGTLGLTYALINNDTEYEVSGYSGTDTQVSISSTYNGKSVTSIGDGAFEGCSSLTSIIIPESVTHIGDYAFRDCSSLQTIYCEAESQPSDWNSGWKNGCDAEVIWGYGALETLQILNPINDATLEVNEVNVDTTYQYYFSKTPTACSLQIEIKTTGYIVDTGFSDNVKVDNILNETTQLLDKNGLFIANCAYRDKDSKTIVNCIVTFTDGKTTVSDTFKLYTIFGCLIAGTLVLMSDGNYKDISSIEEGEKIICYNVQTQTEEVVEIQGIYIADNCDDVYYLHFNDGSKIGCTSLHKWKTQNGWSAISPNINGVGKISIGDTIKLQDGSFANVIAIEKDTTKQTVYHLYMGQEYVMYVTDDKTRRAKMSDTYMPDYSMLPTGTGYGED